MLHITESAAQQLRSLLQERSLPEGFGLRLAVERGGCAGLQYAMEIAESSAGDESYDLVDAYVFVAGDSTSHLDGCTLDYIDDLVGTGFRIVNPRATRSCGCGTSFEPAKSES